MAEPTADQRKSLAKMGIAMPDGSFYIRNAAELGDAIHAVGRATPTADESEIARRNSVRKHIIKRANALKLSDQIPDTWNSDGSLKHSQDDEWLTHFGVKGMRWGVRRDGSSSSSSSSSHSSSDAERASRTASKIKSHGLSSVSNNDLQHLVSRLNLEQQHSKLNPAHVSAGHTFVSELANVGGNVAKQTATAYAAKYAAKGIDHLIKQATKG